MTPLMFDAPHLIIAQMHRPGLRLLGLVLIVVLVLTAIYLVKRIWWR